MQFTIQHVHQIPQLVEQLLAQFPTIRIFALSGEIGAGKTTLVQAFCQKLGIKEAVTSPTFSIVNVYEYAYLTQTHTLYHIDLYRLKSLQEALDIGIEDYLYSTSYCFIEWYELIQPLLPEKVLYIEIEGMPDATRKVNITQG